MSDKGFGDHASKNIVKNPLLSTAVIGVSLEDLTHNAVLLPAVPSQELITRQDEQFGAQERTLGQPAHKLSSGDANSNLNRTHSFSNINLNPCGSQKNNKMESLNPTHSSTKPDDDFDVNEYFARLQGTKYVSAPLNSAIKEERSTNLGAEEDNLEEINLNDPDKSVTDDFQQSITADIAQNFSQLPTVLPQVASAVFNSFSNMLSIKSREQTPEVWKPAPDNQGPQPQQQENVGVPLMSVPDVVKDVAPPPKEPPILGTASNYRITTRKKMYAQIPGLTSGDTTQNVPIYNLPTDQMNVPSFFKPETNVNSTQIQSLNEMPAVTTEMQAEIDRKHFALPPTGLDKFVKEINPSKASHQNIPNVLSQPEELPQTSTARDLKIPTVEIREQSDPRQSLDAVQIKSQAEQIKSTKLECTKSPQNITSPTASSISVIPPPPMFSNIHKTETQINIRSVLPPSIARRIAASNPVLKSQVPTALITPLPNIFVPASEIPAELQQEQRVSNYVPTLMSNEISTQLPNKTLTWETHSSLQSDNSMLSSISVPSVPSDEITSKVMSSQDTDINTKTDNTVLSGVSQSLTSSVADFTYLNLEPTIANLPQELTSKIALPGQIPSQITYTSMPQDQMPPSTPPMYFNPNSLSTSDVQSKENKPETDQNQNISSKTTLLEPLVSESEPVKNLSEPPKISNNYNFRMTKKRPQYYSGPIEGFGSISNNIKPTIEHINTNTFLGSLYSPELSVHSGTSLSGSGQPIAPFDITQPSKELSFNETLDIPRSQNETYLQPEYNTAFDLSRQTTEYFESPQHESKGFGIIGSLKSKLSSIDINKIQNSVTTFFDPAYNYTKLETTSNKENIPHNTSKMSIYSNQFAESENNNLEIYVHDQEPAPQSFIGQNLMAENINITNPQDTVCYAPSYYSHNYFDNTNETFLPSTYPSETHNNSAQQPNNPAPSWKTDLIYGSNNTQNIENQVDTGKTNVSSLKDSVLGLELETLSCPQSYMFESHKVPDSTSSSHRQDNTQPITNFFDISSSSENKTHGFSVTGQNQTSGTKMEEDDKTVKDVFHDQNSEPTEMNTMHSKIPNLINSDEGINILTNTIKTTKNNDPILISQEANEEGNLRNFGNSDHDVFVPTTSLSCVSFFSQPVVDNPNIINFTREKTFPKPNENQEPNGDQEPNIFDAVDFFNTSVSIEKNLIVDPEEENDNDLNICETCREVNKHGEKEVENLTDQLIENITAPIQLSNPVEVPLTESNILDENIVRDFEPNQCAEISHITEETIETIHMQAAAELLDDIDYNTAIIKNYGWCTDEQPLTTSNLLLEHDYTVHPDGSTTGFFQNKSLIFDNIPTNASDEIKAEYKNSFDDTLTILPRQMSIPSAPPPEDDTKSDESGLDVNSIEQDAKKDFPIFEEYVIEPSETDDDKIEFRERERSLDDPVSDTDTFTSRVEKFKKMEETIADQNDDVFGTNNSSRKFELPISPSPSITIASYFDTGNYAVENHYRNSITSPSNITAFQSSSIMRVPPGFEDEFQRKLSLVSNEGFPLDKEEFHKRGFDSASQSSLPATFIANQLSVSANFISNMPTEATEEKSVSPLFESSHNEALNIIGDNSLPKSIQSENKLPAFASVFGAMSNEQSDMQVTPNVFTKIEPKNVQQTPKNSNNESVGLVSDSTTFFTSGASPDVTENSDVYDFSRLSSYFSTPTQADPSKSFFELSQSQNHYRQGTSSTSQNSTADISADSNIDKLNATMLQSQPSDELNIPHETYVANLNLIKDLTSASNIDFIPKEQIVRTVNFFTVIYDDDSLNSSLSKNAETNFPDRCDTNSFGKALDELAKACTDVDDKEITELCTDCCNMKNNEVKEVDSEILDKLGSNKIKFRKFMENSGTDINKEIDIMDNKKEDTGERSFTVNLDKIMNEENEDSVAIISENRSATEYTPVKHHWFYRVDHEGKSLWKGFSAVDSAALENAFFSPDLNENTLVPTDGGRFDVNVMGRIRTPVYWSDKPTDVLRCSWFYKGTSDARYVPYPEAIAEKLEEEYKRGITTGEWHRRLILPNDELVVMHGPSVMVHFLQGGAADAFSSSPQSTMRPRVVRRGCDESEIEESEPSQVDHLLLLCHGVGSACDMRFRRVEEVVDDFRATSLQLLQSHYKNSYESGEVGRVEVLPVSWHGSLHAGEAGVDRRLEPLTLRSVPRLRAFTNDTVLDVLLYTSPVFCQTIIDTVCGELNRIYSLFKSRNPDFNGGVSLGGHSLGSVILYDLLCHQEPLSAQEQSCSEKKYVNGTAGTGQPCVKYPRLQFEPDALYALGSPIAIFECIRGVELLGPDFCLPTCKKFFNIFHPYDPIAYRIEPLINPQLMNVKPFQIPHHKGRKRMHLELKDTMARVGADIKQKVVELIKSSWSSVWKTQPPPSDRQLERVVEEEMEKETLTDETKEDVGNDDEATGEMLGKLNGGRRVDYVLQEAPFEMINEYLFAMSSHVCYWESEDTMLLVLREACGARGVAPDGRVPQHSLTLRRARPPPDDPNIVVADFPSTSRGGV